MPDLIDMLVTYLLSQSSVTSLLGSNAAGSIYGAADLPELYDPKLGAAVLVFSNGGDSHSEITVESDALIKVRVWANVNEYKLCHTVALAVYKALHGLDNYKTSAGKILTSTATQLPQSTTDPDDSWVSELMQFQIDSVRLS